MIGEPRKTGLLGEVYASRYLRDKGYMIVAANYRSKSGEIDIVIKDNDTYCFVEVKTRKEGAFFDPAYAVDRRKEENVKSTAAAFMSSIRSKAPIRFDVLEIILSEGKYAVRYTKNAF